MKSVEKKKSVAVQFEVKYESETYSSTQKLNQENYGFDKYYTSTGYFSLL